MAEFEKRLPKLGQDYIEKMRLPQKLAFTKMEGIGNDYVSGLFFAGEIIDVDAYTGGFNLQIAYSTGYTAALKR